MQSEHDTGHCVPVVDHDVLTAAERLHPTLHKLCKKNQTLKPDSPDGSQLHRERNGTCIAAASFSQLLSTYEQMCERVPETVKGRGKLDWIGSSGSRVQIEDQEDGQEWGSP